MRFALHSILSCQLSAFQSPWRFDVWSALIGAAVAFLLAGLAYVFRATLRQVWEALAAALARVMDYLRVSAEEEYRRLVAAWARNLVVPLNVAPLETIFVEPRLLVPSLIPQSVSEIDPARLGPRLLPMQRVLGAYPQLLILGVPGMGKTSLLAYLARVCATSPFKESTRVESGLVPELVRKRLPLYVPLPVLDWDGADREQEGEREDQEGEQESQEGGQKGQEGEQEGQEDERKRDEVDRLLGAAAAAVGGGSALVKPLRQYLEVGRAIVLVDGWDELSPRQRPQAAAWLAELIGALPGNLWLVGAGMRDYASLTDVGFIPLVLAPWSGEQVEAFAGRWVDAMLTDESPPSLLQDLMAELQLAVRAGSPPLELALQAFAYLSDQQAPVKKAALFDRVLDLLMQGQAQEGEPWWLATCRATLGQVALDLQQADRTAAGREEIEAAIETALPPPEECPARAASRVFQALTGEQGVLQPVGGDRYAFVHRFWQAYLAARQLVAVDPASLIGRLEDPGWSDVLHFYAELGDMGPLVSEWLRTPDDLFCTRLRTLSAWVGAAPQDATWRNGTMAVLARAFLRPGLLPSVRQALAKALAETDMSGVTYFLKQALQRPEAEVRIAALLGLGRVAGEADVAIFKAAFGDGDAAVREAAVQALAYIDNDAAKRLLELVLLEGEDELRPVAAVALVKRGKESLDFLHEMVESEDVMTRRAAVFGLAEAEERALLEKLMREDEQWIVRTAASTLLEELGDPDAVVGISPIPQIDQLPWLISWAATLGEGVGVGDAARQTLRHALREGDLQVRLAAVQVLTQVGRPDDVGALRTALDDPDPAVANAALEALAEIGRRYAVTIRLREG